MILQWKRRLLLGLGLSVALGLVVALPAAASAASTLTGETLNGASASGNSSACLIPTFSVSGTATGPYPGTFTESGSFSIVSFTFNATFTTASGTTTITGSKSASPSSPGFGGSMVCSDFGGSANLTEVPYTATIHTTSGNFHDEGTSAVNVVITGSAATLTESFTSSLTQPVSVGPTNKDECKNGGWRGFFKN